MQKMLCCGYSALAIVLVGACSASPEDPGQTASNNNKTTLVANPLSCELPAPHPRAPSGHACPNTTFVWDEVPGATHYRLNVLTSTEAFLFPPVDVQGISYQHSSDLPHGDLSFNVSAHNDCGRSPASSRMYFTVASCDDPPPPPPNPCGQCFDGFNDCAAACPGTCERRISCGGASAHKCFC
jgi:hypothetical protein